MTLLRPALLLIGLLALSACKNEAPAPVTDSTGAAAQIQTSQKVSDADPEQVAKAEAMLKAAEEAAAKAPPLVEGTDYVLVPNGQPFDTAPGKIEVVEFFGYVCPFCAMVQPTVAAMKSKLPPDVHFVYIPAAFGSMWDNYAKAFYAAEAAGILDKTHDAMFRAIHLDHTLKGERGMDKPEEIAAFYGNYGQDPNQFLSSMQSFAVASKVNRARQYMTDSFNGDQMSTPAFLVDGKYRVKGKNIDDMFRIINQLIVAERAKLGSATPAAAPATEAAPAANDEAAAHE
ncbi:MAG: thiol:disulfide interchange protein DsbA/DsbL [Thermomonas sp.]|uniref:thiol:disulfide interchange protein DsbA/DsbL n=1 Tax=Thermomonas sp. TaxID=1971895 RepID=UPI001ECD13AF|nr:thiol:disulfide interchange protein DsbA/DsbL [Thermomonas sp.]MBV2208322.1 thiol:disulfide interchange protein DsbA/DsbL [Thermomonas sp.]